MVLFRYLLEFYSRYHFLSQQARFLHRSTFLLTRGIRRSDDSSPLSFAKLNKNLAIDDDQMSMQEQFARLELQRLEQESDTSRDEFNSFVDDDNLIEEEFENKINEQEQSHRFIDPRATSIILFPGQGTQFVGMG